MIEITKANFDAETSTGTILLDFSATWCGPCRMAAKVLGELAVERPDLRIGTVDIDDESALAEKFSVASIPLIVLLKDGKEIERHIGAPSKAKLLSIIAGSDEVKPVA